MPTIFDNIDNYLLDGLNNTLENAQRADFCVGYFNLRGWKLIHEKVDKLPGDNLPEEFEDENFYHARVLVGMQRPPLDLIKSFYSIIEKKLDNTEASRLKKRLAREFRDQLTFGTPADEDEIALKKLSSQIKDKKVVVKLYLKNTLHAKLYLAYRKDYNAPIVGYVGSSNLTFSGISKQGELNVDVVEGDAAKKLSYWFQSRWEDRWCIDISDELVDIIDNSWAAPKPYLPYHIYLKMAYHLSREARAGISEFTLPKRFREKLFEYQVKAVQVAAHHLYKRNGVMIGDVVGLGKTHTACAVAKIFEEDFFLETMIICPKNLIEMWQGYVHNYQLHAKIISITQVQSKLPDERRYRLVIIDESHNLRNKEGKRYRAIQEYLRLNDSRVILLTATPYNKTFIDLSSQLRLFIPEDENLGISPENYIESIGGRVQFLARHQVGENSIAAFEKSGFSDDWLELMRLFLVRRTRSFIKANYASFDQERNQYFLTFPDGSKSYFPERIPKKVEYDFDPKDPKDQYAKLYSQAVVNIIGALILPRYGLGQKKYLNASGTKSKPEDVAILDNLSRAGTRLIGFARTNLFKRLESSGYSFLVSICRHILRNHLFIYAYENKLPFPIGKQEAGLIQEFEYTDKHEDDDIEINILLTEDQYKEQAKKYYTKLAKDKSSKFNWIDSKLFNKTLLMNLQKDSKSLMKVLKIGKNWKADDDRQLNALHKLLTKKHRNEKVLIFTQFADTANYLKEQLDARNLEKLACVTGDTDNPTEEAYKFSPKSNERDIPKSEQTRVIITTDVLSEGQNLQDSHIILNYDLPWALIRLIQRAGRVDRIGQESPTIYCYSFLPEDGIDNIINLRNRLKTRITENAETIGSDETFFEGDPVNIRDLYNEKAGILDEDDDVEIDLGSYAFQIWKNATDANPKLNKIIPDLPNVIYSSKKTDIERLDKNGVIVYTKTSRDNDMLILLDKNENVITKSQFEILKYAKSSPDEEPLPKGENHHTLVTKGVENIREIEEKVGGQLGPKTGARYRVYMRLNRYVERNDNTLFVTEELKRSIQEIYTYPLREFARDILNRQLKSGISDEDLAVLVVSLREDGKLCIIEEYDEIQDTQPQIICSLGLIKG